MTAIDPDFLLLRALGFDVENHRVERIPGAVRIVRSDGHVDVFAERDILNRRVKDAVERIFIELGRCSRCDSEGHTVVDCMHVPGGGED